MSLSQADRQTDSQSVSKQMYPTLLMNAHFAFCEKF